MERYGIDLLQDLSNQNQIQSGKFFRVDRSTTALGASSWLDLEIDTVSTGVKLNFQINNSGGLGEVFLVEISTSSTYGHGGLAVGSVNPNRVSTYTAETLCFTSGTNTAFMTSTVASTQGVYLADYYINSSGANISVKPYEFEDKYILKGNTTYVLRLYNRNTSGYASISVFLSEN